MGVARSASGYQSVKAAKDAPVLTRKRPRKRIATGRPRPKAPTGANQVWSYDFVFDALHNWPAVEVPDRDRQVDQGGLGD